MSAATNGSAPLWREHEGRWVERRSGVLAARHGLRDTVAETLAWSELGYSSSGIAKQADTTQATVRDHFDLVEEVVGRGAVLAKRPGELGVDAPAVPGGGTA